MRDDDRAGRCGDFCDPAQLREPARSAQIRLEDVDAAELEPLAALGDRRGHLAARDPDPGPGRELAVACEVVVVERRLGEEDVAVLDLLEDCERVAPVAPAVAEVEHEGDVVAEQAAALAHEVDEVAVARELAEEELHLHGAEAQGERRLEQREVASIISASVRSLTAPATRSHTVGSGPAGRRRGARRRAVELLSGEIVDGDVDGGERVDSQAAAAVVDGRLGQVVPERLALERVPAEEDLAQAAAPGVRVLHEHELADRESWRVGLADAGAALLVGQSHDDGLGRAVEIVGVAGRAKRDRLDLDDHAHRGSPGRGPDDDLRLGVDDDVPRARRRAAARRARRRPRLRARRAASAPSSAAGEGTRRAACRRSRRARAPPGPRGRAARRRGRRRRPGSACSCRARSGPARDRGALGGGGAAALPEVALGDLDREPRAAAALTKPPVRRRAVSSARGPATCPIRRWPSSTRWSRAAALARASSMTTFRPLLARPG